MTVPRSRVTQGTDVAMTSLVFATLAAGGWIAIHSFATGTSAQAAPQDYVGSRACGHCHDNAYRVWQRSAHATIRPGRATTDARCQSCHSTGDAPTGPVTSANIGCEACHGAGADYAPDDVMRNRRLARRLGLRDVSSPGAKSVLCLECHSSSTRVAGFDVEKAWRKIQH